MQKKLIRIVEMYLLGPIEVSNKVHKVKKKNIYLILFVNIQKHHYFFDIRPCKSGFGY